MSENDLPSLRKIRLEFEALCVEQIDLARVAEDVRRLLNDLKDALDMFAHKDKEAGQILTLWGLYRFLETVRVSTRLRAPLLSLISDLTGIPDRKGSEKPLEDLTAKVMASAALDTLVTDGTPMDAAAQKIVEVAGCRVGERDAASKKLINYRLNLQRRRAPARAVEMYQELRGTSAEQWGHLSKRDRAMQALLSVYVSIVPSKC